MTFGQRLEGDEGGSPADIWGKSDPGRETVSCKVPELVPVAPCSKHRTAVASEGRAREGGWKEMTAGKNWEVLLYRALEAIGGCGQSTVPIWHGKRFTLVLG